MRIRTLASAVAAAAMLAVAAAPSLANSFSMQAPQSAFQPGAGTATTACVVPDGTYHSDFVHCNEPSEIRSWYGVDQVANQGAGQTIVLVDAYGTPTGKHDLQKFHDTFFPGYPDPNYDQVCKNNCKTFTSSDANGQSGPAAAANWAGEATLDIEWAYAIAPRAHIVLLAVPPAETEGVQGFPNLFKAMSDAIDTYPKGTVFSQSFGVTEQTFGGAAQTQTAKFDAIYKKANAKGDTMLASSGDDGTTGVSKQHRDTATYPYPTVGWPASSPYVTAVGGTQLQNDWTWNPTSDKPFLDDGSRNPLYWQWDQGGKSEAVWNESWAPIATGGGPSALYSRPSWQNGVASSIGNGGNHRGVPDVAWNAAVNGGVLVYTSFYPDTNRVGWHIYGGTSAASPQMAGVIALANEQQKAAGGDPLGWLNPLLYANGENGGAYHDIVPHQYGTADSGFLRNNELYAQNADGSTTQPGPVHGWPTTTGWDQTTGFGTPNAPAFIAALRAQRDAQG
ncbi:MAG: S53 family peptidase [Solirubrobacteraceae bacterium]